MFYLKWNFVITCLKFRVKNNYKNPNIYHVVVELVGIHCLQQAQSLMHKNIHRKLEMSYPIILHHQGSGGGREENAKLEEFEENLRL